MRYLFLFFCFVYLMVRFFLSNWSYPGFLWDYGSHLTIAQTLDQGIFFQQACFKGESIDFMPIYFGLLLSHFSALGLKGFLNLPLTTVFLLLVDLSLIVFYYFSLKLLFINHKNKSPKQQFFLGLLFTIIFSFLVIPIYASVVSMGMFSLVMGVLWIGGFIYFFEKKKPVATFFLFALAFTYPHFFLFCLPVYFFKQTMGFLRWVLSFFSWLALLILFYIKLSNTKGYFEIPQLPALVLVLVTFAAFYKKTPSLNKPQINFSFQKQSTMMQVNIVYACLAFVFCFLSLLQNAEFTYHCKKFLFWAPFGLCLFLIQINFLRPVYFTIGALLIACHFHLSYDELEFGMHPPKECL